MIKVKISLKTVFSRILLFNIVLVIVATIVPQIIFLNFFKSSYENEINQNNMLMVSQIQKTIDGQVLEKAVSIPATYLSELASNSDLTYALYNDISKDVGKIKSISERLKDIRSTLNFVDSIDLYYTKGNILFIDNGIQFLDDISSYKMHDTGRVDRIINSNLNVDWTPTQLIERYEPRNIVSFVRRVPFNASKEATKAVVSVNINEKVLEKYLTDINSFKTGVLFIVDEEGNIISQSDKSGIFQSFKDSEYEKNIFNADNSGMFQAKIDGKQSVISFTKSTINNWRYVSITSIDEFYQKSYQLKKYLWIVSLALLLLNLLAAVIFTRKAHEPINNLIKSFKSIAWKFDNNDSLNGNNEYKYLSNMVINIESKMDDLNDRLEMNKPLIYHDILLKLLAGRISVHDDSNLLDLKFDKDNFICFVLKIFNDVNLKLEDKMLVDYNLVDILNGEYAGCIVNALIDDNGAVVGIINYSAEVAISQIESIIQGKVETLLNAKYIIAFGNSYPINSEEISRSYNEACVSVKYTFIKSNSKTLYFNDLEIDNLKDTGSSPRLLEKIESFVRSADVENLKYTVSSIIEAEIVGRYKIDFCKNTLMDMVTLIRMTIDTMGYNADAMFGYDIREYFKNIQDINEFRLWMVDIIDIYIEEVNNRKQGLNEDLDIRIKKYIEDNIYNELSLERVAEDLHMSLGHLSRIFKAKNGVTFSSYVTDIKLQHSIQLLHEGKLTVKEISIKLGYNSVQHFIKIFKEKYGYTPKEYQKTRL